MTSYIYVIENKVNGKAYIGKANNIKRRWVAHQGNAKFGSTPLYKAMRKYGIENFDISVVDSSDDENYTLKVLEPKWIAKYLSDGAQLYNLTKGGDGILGYNHTDETKSKMSESQKGKVISEECRQKIRESLLGRSPTEETRKKISEANKDVPKPPRSKEHCKKLSDVAKERGPMSEEQKQKISEGCRTSDRVGHPLDEETRAKISKKLRGQIQSEETRAKRSESLRKFYERKRLASLNEVYSQSSSPPEV
jgi:group I intron endonuclease